MVQFKDKTLLITGGGTGIGEAIAYQFAQRGTNVILTGLGEEQLSKVEERCRQYGVKAWHREVNLEDPASIDALIEYVNSLGLKPDFFVLNAGISQRALTLDCDISLDRKLMEINYFGGIYIIKKFKEHLKTAKEVHIAVTTSISGLFGFPLRSAYCASKHATAPRSMPSSASTSPSSWSTPTSRSPSSSRAASVPRYPRAPCSHPVRNLPGWTPARPTAWT